MARADPLPRLFFRLIAAGHTERGILDLAVLCLTKQKDTVLIDHAGHSQQFAINPDQFPRCIAYGRA